MSNKPSDVAREIADELASCDVRLVASLPDNWLMGLIGIIEADERFVHVRVNREESAIGLCSGAYLQLDVAQVGAGKVQTLQLVLLIA